jgi:transcriptional regulator GlxA family with amidase domain
MDLQRDVTAQNGKSSRHLARRLYSRLAFSLANLHGLHVAVAEQTLEQGDMTVEDIEGTVGYFDLAFLRALLRRHAGMTPAKIRHRFDRQRPS